MVQEIITFLIIALAAFFTLRAFGKFWAKISGKLKTKKAGKCGACNAECSLRELKAAKNCRVVKESPCL